MKNNVHEAFREKMQQAWNDYTPDAEDLDIPEPDFSFLDKKGMGREIIKSEDMDLDFLTQKKKPLWSRFNKIAAVLILVMITVSATALFLNSNMSYGVKGAIQNIRHSINPQEEPTMDETGTKSLDVNALENIENGKKVVSDLYVPEYIPEGYVFNAANFTSTDDVDSIYYEYAKADDLLCIFIDANKTSVDVYMPGKVIKSPVSDKQFYLEEQDGACTMSYLEDAMFYRVSGSIGQDEIAKILENIKADQ